MVVKDGDVVTFFREKDYIMVNNNLGSGAFGKTVVIRDSFIDELFVAKKYEPIIEDQIFKEKFFKSFLDEIKILFKLNHKNIVRIYNYYPFENVQTGYIIMEYIQGKSGDQLRRAHRAARRELVPGGRLEPRRPEGDGT
ncbi:protein kinase, partial [Streptomyces sp. NPDC051907]|uniref:protein kinase domain-containing protein n=1 Tax=Streptomyces sp. NPDC051907 TaxID=3155284 RepID=UPI003417F17D